MSDSKPAFQFAAMKPLAWVETVLKLLAFAVSYYAFAGELSGGKSAAAISGTPTIVRLSVAGFLTLMLMFAVYDRYLDRETFAMIFVFLNIAAHSFFVYRILRGTDVDWALLAFPALMLAGDTVKMFEIGAYHMQVRQFKEPVLYALTSIFVVGYIIILISFAL